MAQCPREAQAVQPGNVADQVALRDRISELEGALAELRSCLTDAIAFEDLFSVEDLQRLQDEFSAATGVASIITRPDGTPITTASNFCRLCRDIIRQNEQGRINCFKSDAIIGRPADGPTIQPCMSGGLWDAGAAITVGKRHLANWLIGQVRDSAQSEDKLREYARSIGADEEAAAAAFREVPAMSRERFGQIAQVLFTMANQLSNSAYQNVLQARYIVERERAEAERRRLEHEYATLFREMLDGFALHEIICDDQGQPTDYRFLEVNPAFERLTGLRGEDIRGQRVREVLPGTEDFWIKTYGRVALTGEPAYFENYSRELVKFFEVRAFRPAPGQFACIFSDITERRKAEMELGRLNLALEAKNAELEQVVYVASHDLRSPLVNIDGYARELDHAMHDLRQALEGAPGGADLLADLAPMLDADIPEALGFIRTSAAKMDALLKGLLRLSRSGRAALNFERLDMATLLSRAVDATEFRIRENGVRLLLGDLPPCVGVAVQVGQVFSNLIDNALKYLVPDRPGVIRIQGRRFGSWVEYCVEDNGIDIAPAYQDKIFEIFHRLDPSRGSGEGLGLTIVRRVLGRLNGAIRVESEPGRGSRFYVTLPAVEEDGAEP